MHCTPGRVYSTKTIIITLLKQEELYLYIRIIIIYNNYKYNCCTALSGESTLLKVYKLYTPKQHPLDSVDKPLIVIDTNTAINLYAVSSEPASTRASVRALVLL